MDVPADLFGPQSDLSGSGRGRGSLTSQVDRATGREPLGPPEPLFRVKRWRRDPPPSFVAPSHKASPTAPKQLLNRWQGQSIGTQYKPFFTGSLDIGGLPPPPLRPRRDFQWDAHPPGLQYVPPSKLSVHSISYRCQLTHCNPQLPQEIKVMQTSAAPSSSYLSGTLDVPENVVKASASDSTTMLALHQQLRTQHQLEWLQLHKTAGRHSELVKVTQGSPNQETHLAKNCCEICTIDLAAYLKSWTQWAEFCVCHQVCPYSPPTVFLADFLQVSSKRNSLGVALTWAAKYAGVPALLSAIQAPITRAYIILSEIAVRKKTAPLPLSFVVYLESCLLKEVGNAADRLLMGSILVLIWSSVRWSDALWISLGCSYYAH